MFFYKVMITIALIPFTYMGIVLTYFGYEQLKYEQDSLSWPVTNGVVVSSKIKEFDVKNVTNYGAYIRYEYFVREKLYSSDRVSFQELEYGSSDPEYARQIVLRYPKGQKLNVHFNPTRPNESVLEPKITLISYFPFFPGIFLLGMVISVVGNLWFLAPAQKRKRAELFRKAASNLGLTFLEEDEMLFQEDFFPFILLPQKGWEKFGNVMRQLRENGETIIFDYEYSQNRGFYCKTVAVFRQSGRNLPEFTLKPEHLFDRD